MRAKRSLGQNFLVDGNLQRRIVRELGAGPGDEVLEIGPGRGALTKHLAGRVGHLWLVELDDHLAGALSDAYGGHDDVTVVHADILDTPLDGLVSDPGSLRVLGNIPYNITTPILFHLLERPRPASVLLMVQREVAGRLLADPGGAEYGALTVGVGAVASVRRVLEVPRTVFRPEPSVDSTVVSIVPHAPPPLGRDEERRLRRLTRAAFQWRRKQMRKILRDHPDLALPPDRLDEVERETSLDLSGRPQTFSPAAFIDLSAALTRAFPEPGGSA